MHIRVVASSRNTSVPRAWPQLPDLPRVSKQVTFHITQYDAFPRVTRSTRKTPIVSTWKGIPFYSTTDNISSVITANLFAFILTATPPITYICMYIITSAPTPLSTLVFYRSASDRCIWQMRLRFTTSSTNLFFHSTSALSSLRRFFPLRRMFRLWAVLPANILQLSDFFLPLSY